MASTAADVPGPIPKSVVEAAMPPELIRTRSSSSIAPAVAAVSSSSRSTIGSDDVEMADASEIKQDTNPETVKAAESHVASSSPSSSALPKPPASSTIPTHLPDINTAASRSTRHASHQQLFTAPAAGPSYSSELTHDPALIPQNGGIDSESAGASSIMGGRPKRIRAVKFSPSKGKTATNRRAAAAVAAVNIANTRTGQASTSAIPAYEEPAIPNNDFCDSCNGRGHFLCCDGCPRSFHFACLNPPLELDEIPAEAWYCKVCEAARKPPPTPKGIFGPLINRIDSENPKMFVLPRDVKNSFRDISTGTSGEFINTNESRPLSGLGKAGKGGYEERDPYRQTKDRAGTLATCHKCGKLADAAKAKRILGCDFCESYWHLDCLDPPLVGMPAPTRRWMCPIHADKAIPPSKKLKHAKVVRVKDRSSANNGDIEILPAPGRFTNVKHVPEELISQGLRYQVPEQIVIMDFWSRLQRDRYGHPLNAEPTVPQSAAAFDFSDSSSLTSMASSPDREREGFDFKSSDALPSATSKPMQIALSADAGDADRSERASTEISDGDPPGADGMLWDESRVEGGDDAEASAVGQSLRGEADGANIQTLLSAAGLAARPDANGTTTSDALAADTSALPQAPAPPQSAPLMAKTESNTSTISQIIAAEQDAKKPTPRTSTPIRVILRNSSAKSASSTLQTPPTVSTRASRSRSATPVVANAAPATHSAQIPHSSLGKHVDTARYPAQSASQPPAVTTNGMAVSGATKMANGVQGTT
ncbi:hypothetical protein EMMF5_004710 [Cystobasidiomycetes sp. EMM_F5]